MPRAFALFVVASCAHGAPAVETTLRAQTQALLDAVTAGDPRVWERYLAPEMSYVSENGTVETKASLVAQITPLPAGITGRLAIAKFAVRQYGDIAVVVHEMHESVSYFGKPVSAEYRMTDVWRRGRDGWRLLASQVHAVNQDPPAIELPAQQLDDYVGTYQVSPTVSYTITRDGDHLAGQRSGGKAHRLAVELRDVLFVPGQPRSRKIFMRDARGAITGFIDRREGRDIPWRRS